MRERKNICIMVSFVIAVSFITSSITALLLTNYFNHVQFQRLGDMSQKIINEQPKAAPAILNAWKEYKNKSIKRTDKNILLTYGYQAKHFAESSQKPVVFFAGAGLVSGIFLFLTAFLLWHRKESSRIRLLAEYLRKVNAGGQGLLLSVSEDEFSKLQDEIYKTVTTLNQTLDAAVEAKKNFADNLSNIAHQLKTPITAISLSSQMMQEHPSPEYPVQIQKQLKRLICLEEALLLLSRVETGTLMLKRQSADVFTLLTLAAENLQELFLQKGVLIDIPEIREMKITVDPHWTMEAIMNLLKNCMEHTPAGKSVHCSCEQNTLYTRILIWDEGAGFLREDIPHLFERFYRGQNAKDSGIGIGLPLAMSIIELQNGLIRAYNYKNGGACFEICFYSH